MSIDQASDRHTLQCMEIWGGIEPVERTVATPGLDLWVFSQPFQGDEQGGDVHYVTLCGGGVITRIVVADVSGHGSSVAEFSSSLRALLRKNINQKSQKRLVEQPPTRHISQPDRATTACHSASGFGQPRLCRSNCSWRIWQG